MRPKKLNFFINFIEEKLEDALHGHGKQRKP